MTDGVPRAHEEVRLSSSLCEHHVIGWKAEMFYLRQSIATLSKRLEDLSVPFAQQTELSRVQTFRSSWTHVTGRICKQRCKLDVRESGRLEVIQRMEKEYNMKKSRKP